MKPQARISWHCRLDSVFVFGFLPPWSVKNASTTLDVDQTTLTHKRPAYSKRQETDGLSTVYEHLNEPIVDFPQACAIGDLAVVRVGNVENVDDLVEVRTDLCSPDG